MKSAPCLPLPPRLPRAHVPVLTLVLALTAVHTACEVTPDKIQTWRDSENGTPKLRAAVRDSSQKVEIRLLAAQALADLGQFDPLAADVRALDTADRAAMTNALADRLLRQMQGAAAQATTRRQVQAKDALFSLRSAFSEPLRARVDPALARWVLDDWPQRRNGEHAGQKVIGGLGKAAGPLLAERVAAVPAAVGELAELVRRVGGAEDRGKAARSLIELAREQKHGVPATLDALGQVGDPEGCRHLQRLGGNRQVDTQGRVAALLALRSCASDEIVDPMVRIAANGAEDGDLREAAFEVLERVKSDRTLTALGELLEAKGDTLRYRAVEAVVSCCKARGVAKLLRTLPSRYTYAKTDVQDYIEQDIRELGKAALPPLRAALSSSSWLARVVAVRLLGDIGTKEDLPRLNGMVDDATKLRGWGDGATIGSEARAAVQRLRKRL